MNARLTPGLMALALLVLTVYGPLAELRAVRAWLEGEGQ